MLQPRKKFSGPPVIREVPTAEAGLTLIEILVVLAIIAVMAYLIVPNVIGRPDQARVTVAQTDLRTISAALKMYRLDTGNYPTGEQGLAALAGGGGAAPGAAASAGTYLEQVPTDPWGRPYAYRSPGAGGTGFEIVTLGKDGKPGGTGVDADITVTGQ